MIYIKGKQSLPILSFTEKVINKFNIKTKLIFLILTIAKESH